MNGEKIDKEKSLNKLIEILKIVDLDFECLSCNKIKSGFLNDLTSRLHQKILDRTDPGRPEINGNHHLASPSGSPIARSEEHLASGPARNERMLCAFVLKNGNLQMQEKEPSK